MKNEIFGGLLEFNNEEQLIEFLKNMDLKISLKVIETAVEYANSRGTYTLQEAYCTFLCLSQLKKLTETKSMETKVDESSH